jgi:hypothetical protein
MAELSAGQWPWFIFEIAHFLYKERIRNFNAIFSFKNVEIKVLELQK